jgi:hypothetical protein
MKIATRNQANFITLFFLADSTSLFIKMKTI